MSAPVDETAVDPTARRSFQDLYRRTWEIELLISGAVLFALLRAPSAVSAQYAQLAPSVAGALGMSVFMGYYYIKLALYTLIVAFTLHLVLRAYWVGLIGLDSVYTEGVRWEGVRTGPVMGRLYRRLPSLDGLIERADRIASVIFSLAFSIILTFVASIIVAGLCSVGMLLVGRVIPPLHRDVRVFWAFYGVAFLLPALLTALDRRFGAGWRDGSVLARTVGAVLTAYLAITLARWYLPINLTVSSHLPRRAGAPLVVAGVTGLILLFFVNDVLLGSGAVRADSYALLPADAGAYAVQPAHYATLRSPERAGDTTPFIQDEVVTGPYVRLFVPIPARRIAAMREAVCPGVPDAADTGIRVQPRRSTTVDTAAVRAAIECLATIFTVTLDGRTIEPDYRVHTDPPSGLRGLLAFVPVGGLGPGAHRLAVARVPRRADFEADAEPPDPHVIPFWR